MAGPPPFVTRLSAELKTHSLVSAQTSSQGGTVKGPLTGTAWVLDWKMDEELDSGHLPQNPQRGLGPLQVSSAKGRGGREEG